MYTAQVIALARAGTEEIGVAAWLTMLPSFQFPTVEWAPGEVLPVERVTFRTFAPDDPSLTDVEIVTRGVILDEDRQRLLDRGWRVRPTPSTTIGVGVPASE